MRTQTTKTCAALTAFGLIAAASIPLWAASEPGRDGPAPNVGVVSISDKASGRCQPADVSQQPPIYQSQTLNTCFSHTAAVPGYQGGLCPREINYQRKRRRINDHAHPYGHVNGRRRHRHHTPLSVWLCHHGECTYSPDHGWSPPAKYPILPVPVEYQRYWPTKWYGQPGSGMTNSQGSFPTVFMPTDTTQLGFYYQRVPAWQPNPAMLPAAPWPPTWHRRQCQSGQILYNQSACHNCPLCHHRQVACPPQPIAVAPQQWPGACPTCIQSYPAPSQSVPDTVSPEPVPAAPAEEKQTVPPAPAEEKKTAPPPSSKDFKKSASKRRIRPTGF